MTKNKYPTNEQIKAYLNSKYDDEFTYVGPAGGTAAGKTKQVHFLSKKFPGRLIWVKYDPECGRYYDDYVSGQYRRSAEGTSGERNAAEVKCDFVKDSVGAALFENFSNCVSLSGCASSNFPSDIEMSKRTANIAAILAEYPYLDYQDEKYTGMSLSEIIPDLKKKSNFNRLTDEGQMILGVIEAALKADDFGGDLAQMRLVSQSHFLASSLGFSRRKFRIDDSFNHYLEKDISRVRMPFCAEPGSTSENILEGPSACAEDIIQACAFMSECGNLFVSYRGTLDGRWSDNSENLTAASTKIQEAALKYFDHVYKRFGEREKRGLIDNFPNGEKTSAFITGHSSGGNAAQYVLMKSKYEGAIRACFSFNSQGFSDAAIREFKKSEDFDDKISRIYSINGKEDPVHSLLAPLALPENTYHIDCGPISSGNLSNIHALEAILDDGVIKWPEGHGATGRISSISRGLYKFSDKILKPKGLSVIVKKALAAIDKISVKSKN